MLKSCTALLSNSASLRTFRMVRIWYSIGIIRIPSVPIRVLIVSVDTRSEVARRHSLIPALKFLQMYGGLRAGSSHHKLEYERTGDVVFTTSDKDALFSAAKHSIFVMAHSEASGRNRLC